MLTSQQEKFKQSLIDRWGSGLVSRAQFRQFSGGLYSPGTVANADSQGNGIPRLTAKGQKCAYRVEDAAEWVASRLNNPDCANHNDFFTSGHNPRKGVTND
jgi:hypothetical protein